jgi:hypothetical protein
MDFHNTHDLENLYGPLWKFSDYKPGQRIRYHRDLPGNASGVVLWVCAPQKIGAQHLPARYIVKLDDDSFPDIVYHAKAMLDGEDSESDSTINTSIESFVVCFAYLSERMSDSSFFYAHSACWDEHMSIDPIYRTSNELTRDGRPTPIVDGTLSLVTIEEMSNETKCCICQQLLKNFET